MTSIRARIVASALALAVVAGCTNGSPAGSLSPAPTATTPAAGAVTRPGTYVYRQSGHMTNDTPWPVEGTLQVGRATTHHSVSMQRQTRARDPQTPGRTVHLRFAPAAVYLQRVDTGGRDCVLTPALRLIGDPNVEGQRWEDDASCEQGDRRTLRFEIRGEMGPERMFTVDGVTVRTVRVETTFITRADGVTVTDVTTAWYAPEYKLVVHAETRTSGRSGSRSIDSDLTETLTSLQPQR